MFNKPKRLFEISDNKNTIRTLAENYIEAVQDFSNKYHKNIEVFYMRSWRGTEKEYYINGVGKCYIKIIK